MSRADPNRELFSDFAAACAERQQSIEAALAAYDGGTIDVTQTLERVAVLLHDHVGDAELLGLRTVSQVAAELERLVHAWQDRLLPADPARDLSARIQQAVHSEAFGGWLHRLTLVSRQACLAESDQGFLRELQAVRMEVTKALKEARPPTYQGVRAVARHRALVLDDSKISRKILAKELGERGYSVAAAATPAEMWKLIEHGLEPQLVLLDYNMPEVKGDDVCRALRQDARTRDVVIIFFSSLAVDTLATIARRSCANGFVSKQDGVEALHSYLDQLEKDGLL